MKNYLAYKYRHKLTQAWLKEHRIELRLHSSLRKSLKLHWYNIIHIYPGRKSQATSTQTHKAEPRRTRYDWLASEYCERASQSERAPQNPASMPKPPKISDPDIVSMVNYMQILRS